MKCLALWALLMGVLIPVAMGGDSRTAVTVRVTVPDGGWSISIREVYRVGDELWAISLLTRGSGMAIQAISKIEDTVTVPTAPLPVKHFVLGKTWKWKNNEPYAFLETRDALDAKLRDAQPVFRQK